MKPVAVASEAPVHKPGRFTFLNGGIASMMAVCFTHPLDLLKVRLQTQTGPKLGALQATKQIIKTDGVLALYNGLSASLLRQASYSTVRFGAYAVIKEKVQPRNADGSPAPLPVIHSIGISMLSGAIGGVVGNPADIVNIRMQADGRLPPEQRRNYKHAFDGLYRLARHNGVGSLFVGLAPNITRAMVMTVGQMTSYDFFKSTMLRSFPQYFSDNLTTHFTASVLAATVATILTAPIDITKTRIMNSEPGEYKSGLDCFAKVLKNEGPLGLYKGFVPAFVRLGPQTILTFVFMEQLKKIN